MSYSDMDISDLSDEESYIFTEPYCKYVSSNYPPSATTPCHCNPYTSVHFCKNLCLDCHSKKVNGLIPKRNQGIELFSKSIPPSFLTAGSRFSKMKLDITLIENLDGNGLAECWPSNVNDVDYYFNFIKGVTHTNANYCFFEDLRRKLSENTLRKKDLVLESVSRNSPIHAQFHGSENVQKQLKNLDMGLCNERKNETTNEGTVSSKTTDLNSPNSYKEEGSFPYLHKQLEQSSPLTDAGRCSTFDALRNKRCRTMFKFGSCRNPTCAKVHKFPRDDGIRCKYQSACKLGVNCIYLHDKNTSLDRQQMKTNKLNVNKPSDNWNKEGYNRSESPENQILNHSKLESGQESPERKTDTCQSQSEKRTSENNINISVSDREPTISGMISQRKNVHKKVNNDDDSSQHSTNTLPYNSGDNNSDNESDDEKPLYSGLGSLLAFLKPKKIPQSENLADIKATLANSLPSNKPSKDLVLTNLGNNVTENGSFDQTLITRVSKTSDNTLTNSGNYHSPNIHSAEVSTKTQKRFIRGTTSRNTKVHRVNRERENPVSIQSNIESLREPKDKVQTNLSNNEKVLKDLHISAPNKENFEAPHVGWTNVNKINTSLASALSESYPKKSKAFTFSFVKVKNSNVPKKSLKDVKIPKLSSKVKHIRSNSTNSSEKNMTDKHKKCDAEGKNVKERDSERKPTSSSTVQRSTGLFPVEKHKRKKSEFCGNASVGEAKKQKLHLNDGKEDEKTDLHCNRNASGSVDSGTKSRPGNVGKKSLPVSSDNPKLSTLINTSTPDLAPAKASKNSQSKVEQLKSPSYTLISSKPKHSKLIRGKSQSNKTCKQPKNTPNLEFSSDKSALEEKHSCTSKPREELNLNESKKEYSLPNILKSSECASEVEAKLSSSKSLESPVSVTSLDNLSESAEQERNSNTSERLNASPCHSTTSESSNEPHRTTSKTLDNPKVSVDLQETTSSDAMPSHSTTSEPLNKPHRTTSKTLDNQSVPIDFPETVASLVKLRKRKCTISPTNDKCNNVSDSKKDNKATLKRKTRTSLSEEETMLKRKKELCPEEPAQKINKEKENLHQKVNSLSEIIKDRIMPPAQSPPKTTLECTIDPSPGQDRVISDVKLEKKVLSQESASDTTDSDGIEFVCEKKGDAEIQKVFSTAIQFLDHFTEGKYGSGNIYKEFSDMCVAKNIENVEYDNSVRALDRNIRKFSTEILVRKHFAPSKNITIRYDIPLGEYLGILDKMQKRMIRPST